MQEINSKLEIAFENMLLYNFDFIIDNIMDAYSIKKPERLFFFISEEEWNKIMHYYYENIFAKKEQLKEKVYHLYKEQCQIIKEIKKYYPSFYENRKEKIDETDNEMLQSIFMKLHSLIGKVVNSNDLIKGKTKVEDFAIAYNNNKSTMEYNINSDIDINQYNKANLIQLRFNNSELQKFIDIALKKYITLDESDKESIKLINLIILCNNVIDYNNKKIESITAKPTKTYRLITSK